ncbi:lysylphosphatidylglycerol synthase transmembrane domain-containing protein [Dyadobacter diqingensis]|uniref:lysylphosphatidylglycerol synthase transmembrane domain-containing protein n=1 Tax=Dyadobacter diqingensis TaxID=2938121 RepID=UPI0020C18DBC|nr:lysylphosphatidylglycerol synthase transmembrane domain-containing protein [Dyadobacter diqingensis]
MVQDKQLSTPKEKTTWQKLFWLGKLVVTLLILSYIYKTFQNEQKGVGDIGAVYKQILTENHLFTLLTMLLLVPLNWALESLKWQRLASKAVSITFREAFRGTLTGLAVGVAAPAQLGDTIGRVAALKSDDRLKAIGAAVVSNGIQFYVSLIFGGWGLASIGNKLGIDTSGKNMLYGLLISLCLLGILVVLFRKRLTNWQPRRAFLVKSLSYFRIIGAYTGTDLLVATGYGMLRYLVFLSQFLLALSLFDFPMSFIDLAACVALIFLAKTLIPAINVLGDLGLREFTALFVFKQYNLPPEQVIAATFLVWTINVLGPILVGIFLIWKYKWKGLK